MTRSTTLTSLLFSVGLLSGMAQSAEAVNADLTTGLRCVGSFSIKGITGTPDDVEQLVALKANENGASYYRILQMKEDTQPNRWYVMAEMYS